ncbi:MAG: TlpA family protein disulfide reductase [Thermodesulfovibrionales bacterium]
MSFKTFIVISLLSVLSFAGIDDSLAYSDTGKVAPVFELKDLEGKKVSLTDFKGKVILLNFWATWCAPCKAEMPSLENLYRSLKDKGLVVIGVSVDNSEKTVHSFIEEKGITFPILLDKGKEVSFDDYGVIGLPVTFLIDKKGIIVDKVFGERQWDSEEVKEKIKRLLEGR